MVKFNGPRKFLLFFVSFVLLSMLLLLLLFMFRTAWILVGKALPGLLVNGVEH